MQGVVGGNVTFLDTAIGYPGYMHNARILRASNTFTKAENDEIVDIVIVDKTDPAKTAIREMYWINRLKTMYPSGLNIDNESEMYE